MLTKPLLFLGSNSNLQIFIETAQRQGLTVAGIVDKDYFGNAAELHGLPVVGSELEFEDSEKLADYQKNYNFFIATNWSNDVAHIRDTEKRKYLIGVCRKYNIDCINLIDPSAIISSDAKLGKGIYIGSFVYVEPNTQIDDFAQLWFGTGISHGSKIGENTILQRQCGISGVIGKNVYVGLWVKIFNSGIAKIGDNVVINPGLYVARDVKDGEHVRLTRQSQRVYQYPAQIDAG